MPASVYGLYVFELAESRAHDRFKLVELRQMLTRELAEPEWRTADVRSLEERMHTVQLNLDALQAAHACVDELASELAILSAGTEQEKAERNTSVPWNS